MVKLEGMVNLEAISIASLLPKFSDEMLENTLARLNANLTFPGAAEAFKFTLEEKRRRHPEASPPSAPTPTTFARAPVLASRVVPPPRAIEAAEAEQGDDAALEEGSALALKAQALVFQAEQRGEHLDVVDAVRMARSGTSEETIAGKARQLVAEYEERGEYLDVADAVARVMRDSRG